MMSAFGCTTDFDGISYFIKKGSRYQREEYQIEPDVSAACYFYGIAALNGGSAIVRNVHTDTLQGDIQFIEENTLFPDIQTVPQAAPMPEIMASSAAFSFVRMHPQYSFRQTIQALPLKILMLR